MRPLANLLAEDTQVCDCLDRLSQTHLISADCTTDVLPPEQEQEVDTDELVRLQDRGVGAAGVTNSAGSCDVSLQDIVANQAKP